MITVADLADAIIAVTPNDEIRKCLRRAARFRISNVAHYWDENCPGDGWKAHEELPNIAPLGNDVWFEWDEGEIPKVGALKWGVLCALLADRVEDGAAHLFRDFPDDTRFVVSCMLFCLQEDGQINMFDTSLYAYSRADGSSIGFSPGGLPPDFVLIERDNLEEGAKQLLGWMAPALLATCFAHCKNVVQREVRPSRQVYRQARRKGKAVITYKVLDIDPARQVLASEGGIVHNGLARALHICRGHFAHYTNEKPLFGKLTGTFYVPMHMRGTLKAGAVIKDYNVKAPSVAQ